MVGGNKLGKHSKRKLAASSENLGLLSSLDLKKFCSKPLCEIEMAIHKASPDLDLLKSLLNESRKYEHLSSTYFIAYEDIFDLVRQLKSDKENVSLPLYLRNFMLENKHMKAVLASTEIEPHDFALLVKAKIIEVLYKNYISEVVKMKKRQAMKDELNKLIDSKECEENDEKSAKKGSKTKGGKNKGNKSKSTSSKGKNKKHPQAASDLKAREPSKTETIDDYTEIALEENDIIYDYNVDNHTIFIILVGFNDANLLNELAKIKVNTSAVIEVSSTSNLNEFNPVISEIYQMFANPQQNQHLENTIFMKYININLKSSMKDILEEFLYVAKRVNYLKRQHLVYLRHLNMFNFGDTPKKLSPKCLVRYNTILNDIPVECINIALIIDALVEEVLWRENGQIYSTSDLSISSNDTLNTTCSNQVFDNEQIDHHKVSCYQVHEDDNLYKILKSYSDGRRIYHTTLRYLKLLISATMKSATIVDLEPKIKDKSTPLEYESINDKVDDIVDYIHLALFKSMKHVDSTPNSVEEDEFNRNLIINNEIDAVAQLQTHLIGNVKNIKNDYSANILELYNYKENLTVSVFLQIIYNALTRFSYCDKVYSTLTRSILAKFHENLNQYGIKTVAYNQSLRSAICLRDFCRFIPLTDQNWINTNKLVDHMEIMEYMKKSEECEGMSDLKISGIYDEYNYLLGSTDNKSDDRRKSLFNEMMLELAKYPHNINEIFSTSSDSNIDKSFCGYDLGVKQIQLQGGATTFYSFDDVKVVVDNSRFLTEDFKCIIKIISAGNTFVYHSNDPDNFHFILSDETILLFSRNIPNPHQLQFITTPLNQGISSRNSINKNNNNNAETANNSLTSLIDLKDFKILGVRRAKLPKFLINIDNNDDKIYDNLLELFKGAVKAQKPIYKVAVKPATRHIIKKTLSTSQYHLAGIIKRVLCKNNHKIKSKGHCVRTQMLNNETINTNFDIKITWPNGLLIETLPKTSDLVEIKQLNKYRRSGEEYRMFYKNGVVLIKNRDGTTKIMRSNGDLIDLTDRICYDKSCINNIAKLFQDKNIVYFPSRFEREIKSDDSDFIMLYEFGDIPYAKKTVLDFNGKQSVEFNGKMTERQLHYVIHEDNYYAEEKCFKRDDGFRCIVDKNGRRLMQFPDGTRICSWYKIEKDLIYIDEHVKSGGWISVSISYQIEHPNYATIIFDGYNKSTQIFSGNIKLKICDHSMTMCLGDNIAGEITSDSVVLLKNCNKCNLDCLCKVNLSPKDDLKLLEVYDTYGKNFVTDIYGSCSMNLDFIKGAFNKEKCNHKAFCNFEQLFTLNTEYTSGCQYWSKLKIEERLQKCINDPLNVKLSNYYNKTKKCQTVEIYTNIYQDFAKRFINMKLLTQKIGLSKNTNISNKTSSVLYYVLFRILYSIQDPMNYESVIEKIKSFAQDNNELSQDLLSGFDNLINVLQSDALMQQKKMEIAVMNQEKIESSKIVDESRVESNNKGRREDAKALVKEIILEWHNTCEHYRDIIRNKRFVPYFQSEFYTNK